ncbi:MAG: SUMF1/EgtB/PvdO family nonheme iron enzyme [Muribaculaceae bacterium]|nr:SUMF1/EgtB/PvdO family nonheme iron enzyme [Muribaculaceae bacterium]
MLTLCLMAMCWIPMSGQTSSLRGDVDNDNAVTISDVTSLINYLLNEDMSGVDRQSCDVNLDGVVTIDDVTELINYLLTDEWPYVPYEPVIEEFTVSGVTFRMILVEGGTFMMGGRDNDPYVKPWEFPVHQVTLSDYYIGETEVTQALWRAVMGTSSNPSWFCSTNGYSNNYQRPVEKVTYANCTSFLTKLKQQTGKTFRLLTEAEWEYAARGGKYSRNYMFAGGNDIDEVAWHIGNSGEITHAVATKAPNELGIYDMAGNVGEWCSDWYGDYSATAQTNPTGPNTGSARVVRGGSWNQAWRMNRVTYRHEGYPTTDNVNVGFRLALVM